VLSPKREPLVSGWVLVGLRGGDHFPDGPANGVETLHWLLPSGLYPLDDPGDAPSRVTGQADNEGHRRALDRDNVSPAMSRIRRPSATHGHPCNGGVVDEPSLSALKIR